MRHPTCKEEDRDLGQQQVVRQGRATARLPDAQQVPGHGAVQELPGSAARAHIREQLLHDAVVLRLGPLALQHVLQRSDIQSCLPGVQRLPAPRTIGSYSSEQGVHRRSTP